MPSSGSPLSSPQNDPLYGKRVETVTHLHTHYSPFQLLNGLLGGGTHIVPEHVADLLTHDVYKVSQEECARLRESVPYVKVYRYNPKHLYPKLNGYGDNDQRSLKL